MKCKSCKNVVPDGSVFCNHCGEKLVRTKREKQKEVSVPKAKKLPSGTWFIEMQIEGERHSVSAKTEADCRAKAVALKTGLIEASKRNVSNPTLRELVERYIETQKAVLSPSTVREYRSRLRTRFQEVMDQPYNPSAEWQAVISEEAMVVSAKTLKNAWGLVSAAVRSAGLPVPDVKLPAVPKREKAWLDHTQIPVFVDAVRGQPCELAALLGLHGLRRSEIYALRVGDIDLQRKTIRVAGALVMDDHHHMVRKDTTKNAASSRIVPIMIPALEDLLPSALGEDENEQIVKVNIGTITEQINRVCRSNHLPEVGLHGLRHSFASLAHHLHLTEHETMQLGGWSDHATMHKKYTHLSIVAQGEAGNKISEFFKTPNKTPNE